MEEEKKQALQVFLTHELEQKLTYLTKHCNNEIGGVLLGNMNKGNLVIDDVIVPKQTVSGGHVDMNATAVADAIAPLIKKNPKIAQRVKGWWHSHYNFGTHWSHKDEETIESLVNFMNFCVSINTNQDGNILIRLDINKPFCLSLDELDYDVLHEKSEKIETWCKKEIEKKIEQKVYFFKGRQSNVTTPNKHWYYHPNKGWVEGYIKAEDEYLVPAAAFQFNSIQMFQNECHHLWRAMSKKEKKAVKKYFKNKIKGRVQPKDYEDYMPDTKTLEQREEEEYEYRTRY